jgi:hypothetical protein
MATVVLRTTMAALAAIARAIRLDKKSRALFTPK